jgi:hypothetical protein
MVAAKPECSIAELREVKRKADKEKIFRGIQPRSSDFRSQLNAWRQSSADMADFIACGAAIPNPLGAASSKHHGRRRQRSISSESTVGASNLGGSADVTKKRFFTHDNQQGYGWLHRLWRCHPQSTSCRFIPTPWATPPTFGFVGINGGGE